MEDRNSLTISDDKTININIYINIYMNIYKNVYNLPSLPPTRENPVFASSVCPFPPLSMDMSVFASQFLAFEI